MAQAQEDQVLPSPALSEKLVAMMAIALVWCLLIGQWQAALKLLKLKKHGCKPISLLRRGLDFLRRALLFPLARKLDLDNAFGLLLCT